MLFNSFEFLLVFLPATLALYYGARRWFGLNAALGALAAASLVFYGYWSIRAVPLLLASIAANYLLGLWLYRSKARAILIFGIVLNLSVLGFFKYANFFAANWAAIAGAQFNAMAIILPLGISFFTFEQITFLVDVYRGRTEPGRPLTYGLFVGFFPHLIAGPIVQHRDLGRQLAEGGDRDAWRSIGLGLSIFAIGLAKKVLLAETLEPYASGLFEAADRGQTLAMGAAWVAALAYSLQIFFDFSGYSDMATGLARMLGYKLPINFLAPYRSGSIIEFWRRWHISLSTFLRDYLYIPLGGNRLGSARRYINLLATMLIGGLWHGASWTFVAWGGLHGLYLTVAHIWTERVKPKPNALRKMAFGLLTLLAVVIAWVPFRAKTLEGAGRMLGSMAGIHGFMWEADANGLFWIALGFALIALAPDTAEIFARADAFSEADKTQIRPAPRKLTWRANARWAAACGVMLFWSVIYLAKTSEFIYYQF
jgi:D-alanyl-lipoteichoic acid acyltransferase DltB (MBOAT superfamily)